MRHLRLEPEGIDAPGGLVSRLLAGDSSALGLFPQGVFDPAGASSDLALRAGSSLAPEVFHCRDAGTRDRLDRALGGEGLVVTTGQQPQLFGGPLLVLYKALSAVRAAADIERRLGTPCLAVFWVAADDHDWPEVASVGFLDREEELRRLEIRPPPGREGRSVGPTMLPLEIEEVTRDFLDLIETNEPGDRWLDVLRDQYVSGRSFTDAFIGVVCDWLDGLPIAFLDAAHPDVRRASVPMIQRVLEKREIIDAALRSGTDAVVDLGHRAQLTHLSGMIPLFRDSGRGRYRLRGIDGPVQADPNGSTLDVEDLVAEAASHSDLFSPSAALRPVLESWLLPVAATVLGPGEIAYWSQLGPLFESLQVAMPGIRPRASWRIVEPRVSRLLDKTGITADDLRDGTTSAVAGLVRRSRPRSVEDALQRLADLAETEFGGLDETIARELPGLRSAVGKSRSQVLSSLGALRKTLDSATRERERTAIGQLHRAAANLYPEGIPQERALAAYVYLARHGDHLLEAARTATLGAGPKHVERSGDSVAGGSSSE